jgi:hypothetical protein
LQFPIQMRRLFASVGRVASDKSVKVVVKQQEGAGWHNTTA